MSAALPPRGLTFADRRSVVLAVAETPFLLHWRAEGRRARRAPVRHPVTRPASPVLLLPGVFESPRFLDPLADPLGATGRPVHRLPELARNTASLPASTRIAADYLERHDLTDVTLVAHSKGGLIGKQLMLAESTAHRIRDLVAFATPFAGSRFAVRMPLKVLRAFDPADADLVALGAEHSVDARITSIFARVDPQIPGGSRLEGAHNVELPMVGHFRVLGSTAGRRAMLEVVSR